MDQCSEDFGSGRKFGIMWEERGRREGLGVRCEVRCQRQMPKQEHPPPRLICWDKLRRDQRTPIPTHPGQNGLADTQADRTRLIRRCFLKADIRLSCGDR